jgi:hypothetical protein
LRDVIDDQKVIRIRTRRKKAETERDEQKLFGMF